MTDSSLRPPYQSHGPRYAAMIVLLLLGGVGLWFWMGAPSSQSKNAPAESAPPEAPKTRAQFVPELEIPAEDEIRPTETPEKRSPRRSVECKGVLEASDIQGALDGLPRQQVLACYERRLKENNLLQGSMNVTLTIGPTGDVTSVGVRGSLNDSKVFSCVRKAANGWHFPKPTGGCVQTSIPFTMTPKR